MPSEHSNQLTSGEGERIFTPEELREMVTPAGDLACDAIVAGNVEKARQICTDSVNMHVLLHSNYSLWHGETLAYVIRNYGVEAFHAILPESIEPWLKPLAESFRNGVTREAVVGLAQIWRMYCPDFGPVEEDDEIITFSLGDCGNGWAVNQDGSAPTTYAEMRLSAFHVTGGTEPNIPLFACAALHGEALMTKWLSYPPFVMDFSEGGLPQQIRIYKNPSNIPVAYFERAGAIRDSRRIRGAVDVAGGRLFSQTEREDIPRQHVQRALLELDAGEFDLARGYCQLSKGEWYPGHHIHRDWITGMLSAMYRKFGVDATYDCVKRAYNEPMMDPMLKMVEAMSLREQVEGFAAGFRQHAMRFRIEEDDEKFVIVTEPCGSGGRLLDEDAYNYPKNFAKIKERHKAGFYIEDFPVYCMHCPATNEHVLKRGGPYYLLVDGDLMHVPDGNCNFYIFKDPDAVPDRFYRRADLDRRACTRPCG